jgi:polar amino acid transport system substrate-binding protein
MSKRRLLRVPSFLAAASVAGVLIAGCSSGSSASSAAAAPSTGGSSSASTAKSQTVSSLVPAKYRSSGTISIATATGNPPYENIQPGATAPTGFDIDVITAVVKNLGLTPDITVVQFPSIVVGLADGRFDAGISSLTITAAREQQLDMVTYMKIGTGLLVRAGNPDGITGIANLCGKTVGVAQGSSNLLPLQAEQAQCGSSPIKIVQTNGNDFVGLQSDRVDAMALDAAGAVATAKANPSTFEAVPNAVYGAGLAGIAVGKSNSGLATAFEASLKELIANGTYSQLLAKWGLQDLGDTNVTLNPTTQPAA